MIDAGISFPAREVTGQLNRLWLQWHVIVSKHARIDYAIYRSLGPNPELAKRIAKYGIDLKLGRDGAGKEFRLHFAGFRKGQAGNSGMLDLYAYPTNSGKVVFRPNCPPVDAIFGLFYVLVNTLGYAVQDALHLLESFQLVFLEIEREILSDPLNALPLGSQVTAYLPEAGKHIDADEVTMSVDNSKKLKEVTLKGKIKSTVFMDTAMRDTGQFVQYFREEIDAARETADQVAAFKEQVSGDLTTLQYTTESNTEAITEHARRETTLNKDLTELLKRVPPDLAQKVDAIVDAILQKPGGTRVELLLERILEATQNGHLATRQAVEYQTTEVTEQIRGVSDKLDQVQRGNIAQTRFMNRKLNTILRSIEDIQQQLAGMSTGTYRVQRKMQPVYAKAVHFLETHSGATLGEVAAHLKVPLPLAWYYLKRLAAMGLVERQKRQKVPPTQLQQPKNEAEAFVQDLEQLGRDLGIIPATPPIMRKQRGPRVIWKYFVIPPSERGVKL